MKTYIKQKLRESLEYISPDREQFSTLYHGTDINSAINMRDHGIDVTKSTGGYFGVGFYTTPDLKLAKSNYADFAYEEEIEAPGAIVEVRVKPEANILDLRNSDDWDMYQPHARGVHDRNFYKKAISLGIDGLWDNSFEGVIIYNTDIIEFVRIHNL